MTAYLLLVDDDDLLRRSLAFNLEKAGYRVSTAATAEDALLHAQRRRPDLVVLDIGLPGMDGYELAASLRKMPDFEHTLFVGLSGFKRRQESGEARSHFDHYFVKPVDLNKLQAVLESHARPPPDDQRAAAASQGTAGAKQAIISADKTEQMVGYLGDIELPVESQPVEGLNILQPFAEAETARIDQPVNKRVKYECIIGAG